MDPKSSEVTLVQNHSPPKQRTLNDHWSVNTFIILV